MRGVKSFFFASAVLLLLNFISAVSCTNIGSVSGSQYCDTDGVLKNLKADGASCLNNYECINQSCSDGVCKEKYFAISEKQGLMNSILSMFGAGYCGDSACNSGENCASCAGDCGACSNGGGGGGGGGGACSPLYNCTEWSQRVNGMKCGIRSCRDIHNCGFRTGKPIEILTCPGNVSGSSYCGDGACDSDETVYSCAADCKKCGDGICDLDEDAVSCPADCNEKKESSGLLFWILILCLIAIIAVVIYYIIKKYRGGRAKDILATKPEEPKGFEPMMSSAYVQKPIFEESPIKTVSSTVTKNL